MPQQRTALVFGSGGARGWAHAGVLLACRELGFNPDIVVGTSIGAVAAAVCATDSLDAALDLAATMDWRRAASLFVEFGFPRSGLIEGRRIMELLQEILPDGSIADLPIPFAAVATDLMTQEEVVLSSGSLHAAIRASIAIPGVFTPAAGREGWLVDGGLVNPLPISVARSLGADHIVAVDINLLENPDCENDLPTCNYARRPAAVSENRSSLERLAADAGKRAADKLLRNLMENVLGLGGHHEADQPPALLEVLVRSLRTGENSITRERLLREPPDLLLQPAVGHIGTLDFHRADFAIRSGYAATMQHASYLREVGGGGGIRTPGTSQPSPTV